MRTILFLLISLPVFAQNFPEQELTTKINEVTVFVSGAHITRNGEVTIPAGETIITARGLTPHINDESVQVKGLGAFTILAVNHRINYLQDLMGKDEKIDSLRSLLEEVDGKIALEKARQEVLQEKLSLLNVNKKLGGEDSGVTVGQLQQAVNFYETQILGIKKDEIASRKTAKQLNTERSKIQKQLNEWNSRANVPSGEVSIRVRSNKPTKGKFTITYFARNAGWSPQYDIRVTDIESPVELNYKAEVYQNTGVDWTNVKLKFSNGNPNQSGTAPRLSTWHLYFQEEQNPFARKYSAAPAEVAGGFGQAEEDAFGFADDMEMELAEVVTTAIVENQTSVVFEVSIPYSVQSNGERFTVDLNQHEIPAKYQYYAVPKLDKDAFLIAKIAEWNQFNLLSGPANLYFEEAYVGKSYLDAQNVEDTLQLSLGRDKSIVVSRKKIDEFSKKRTIGNNKVESRGYEISVRNSKSQNIELAIFDQIPVSTNSDITVESTELGGGVFNSQSGEIRWDINLTPASSREITFKYEVKYPKKRRLILE